jgi:hypothetical protein
MAPLDRKSLLFRYFAGITEQTFESRLGVADPPVVDYLTDLLVRFIRSDAVFRVRSPSGQRLVKVADMFAEAEARIGTARREVHRHIGDYTLFWSGVYPETLEHARPDRVTDYQSHGKRAYYIASTIEAEEDTTPAGDVLERLSAMFDVCAYGLGEVRGEWERREGERGGSALFLIN